MLSLFFIGPTVERFIGSKNFFLLYFAAGLGAVVLRSLMQYLGFVPLNPAVGASGAIFGVVTAFATLFPHQKLYLMFFPVPIKAMYLIGASIAFTVYAGMTGAIMPRVAHFAHLGGAIVGFLMAWFWFKKYNFKR